jgi:hypothetical protein
MLEISTIHLPIFSISFHYWDVAPTIMYGEVVRSQWGSYNMTKHLTTVKQIEALEVLNFYSNLCDTVK